MNLEHTPSQTCGPYLHIGLTDKGSVMHIASPGIQGERLLLKCRVLDADGVPIDDAMIEIWQANAEGTYNHPADSRDPGPGTAFHGFGRAATDESGNCEFETIKPGRVPGPQSSLQAPHLNVLLFGRGILLHLHTRIYFDGDPANEADPVLRLVPEERRVTLFAHPDPERPGTWHFEFRLRGERETVFFDV